MNKHLSPILILTAILTLGFTRASQARNNLEVTDVKVTYNFGAQITFQARLVSAAPIAQASLSFREINEQNTRLEPLTLNPDGTTSFTYDASRNVLPPFATIVFSYQATLTNGQIVTSAPFDFIYEDNRFPWQTLGEPPVRVHWYHGDAAFGQAALDAARAGLQGLSSIVPVSLDAPVEVYIYATTGDLQSALSLGGRTWVAGHADPRLGVVMVSVAPGETQTIELQRQIPHEMAHVMLYRSVGASYDHLPAWLNEGLASMAELYPNPDYARALQIASRNNSLIPLTDLCAAFPPDSGRAFLAYAESESFVRYLREKYGNTGLVALTQSYADGLDCDLGATRAVGTPLNQLDTRWRENTLGQNIAGATLSDLLPYLIIMGLVLIVPLWGAIGAIRTARHHAGTGP